MNVTIDDAAAGPNDADRESVGELPAPADGSHAPADGSHAPVGDSALTAEENAILDLEETWWTRGRNKTEAIATIGMAPTRYYLLLNRILANPQARMERPELVGRLLRLRQRRAEERRMGNVPPGEEPAG